MLLAIAVLCLSAHGGRMSGSSLAAAGNDAVRSKRTQARREEDCPDVRASGFPKGKGGATGIYHRMDRWLVNNVPSYRDSDSTNYMLWCPLDNTWVISPVTNLAANAVGDACVGVEASMPTSGFVEVFETTWKTASSGQTPSVVCDTSGLDRAEDDDDNAVLLLKDGKYVTEEAGGSAGLSVTAIVGIVIGGVIFIILVSLLLYYMYCPSHDDATAVEVEESVVREAIIRAVSARNDRRKSAKARVTRSELPQLRTSVAVKVPDGRSNGQGDFIVDLPPLLPSATGSDDTDDDYGDDSSNDDDAWEEHDGYRRGSRGGGHQKQRQQLPPIGDRLPPVSRRASVEAPF